MSYKNYPGRPADGVTGPNNGKLLWHDSHDNEFFYSELKIEKPRNQSDVLIHSGEVLPGEGPSGNLLVITEAQALSMASEIRNWIKERHQRSLLLGPFTYRNEEFKLFFTSSTYKVQGDDYFIRFQNSERRVNNRHPLKIKEIKGLAMALERAANI